MKTRWPMYRNDALTGAGCSAHADDECLCDVVVPANHPWSNAPAQGGMWAHTTAEHALATRGNYDPKPLEIMLQIVALHDAIGGDVDNIRHAMEHIAKYHEFNDKSNNAAIGALVRAIRTMGPEATANALDRSVDDVLAQAYGTTEANVKEARRLIAIGGQENSDDLRVLLGASRSNVRGDNRRAELLRWLGYHAATNGEITLEKHHQLYDLVVKGATDEECARIIGCCVTTIGRFRRGERGPLKAQFKTLKAQQKAAKKKAKENA